MQRSRHFPLFYVIGILFASPAAVQSDDVTDIVINEVMYNPASGDNQEDFIELYNQSASQTYSLQNFQFTSGLVFTFPNVSIGPQQYLVVCANETRIRQLYGITNTVGNWDSTTSLDNGGERIKLVNAAAVEIEDFSFDDRNPWPILADGYGHSLERRDPAYDNDNPANWAPSAIGSGWTKVVITGLATSSRMYFYLSEAGTAYLDDVKLSPVGNPGDNRIANGTFEGAALTPWAASGNHSGSSLTTEEEHGGSKSLKIVATGAGASSGTSVNQDNLGLTVGQQYMLEFHVLFTDSGQTLIARLSGSDDEAEFYIEARGGGATPGQQNSVFATDIPPFIYPGNHSPEVPTSSSAMTLLAQAEDDVGVVSVTAHWDAGAGEQSAPMYDDGAHGDGAAADGLFGVSIGTFGTGTIVRYWFTATDTLGQAGRYPFAGNPTPALGFYIQPPGINPSFDLRSNSGLTSNKPPVYHLLIDPGQLTGNPPHLSSPSVYVRGTFIFNGEVFDNIRVRHRGQSSLGVSKKHWKVDFNKDHRFRTPFADHSEVDNINIQSSYGDKTFLREWLSYKTWIDVGLPGLEMWPVRLYLNGAYRGLYVHLENPNADWLDRTDLDAEGWLWKSYSQAQGGTGGFELKADGGNASAATNALGTFISNMNTLTGQALLDYINTNMEVSSFIDFLALHQLIHNCDHPAKNYLVYADEDSPPGSWTYFLWDADLTHGRNYECAGGGVYNDTIRSDMFSDPQLLFGTQSRPKCDGPWNGVINGFLGRTTSFRARFYQRTRDLLEQLYHPGVLNPIIDAEAANLQSPVNEVDMDWNRNTPYGNRSTYQFHVNALKSFVQSRYNYLDARLDALITTVTDLDGLTCQRSGNNASLSWNRHGTYDSIRVYRNGSLLSTLAGTANSTSAALDLGTTVNSFRVAAVIAGSEQPGQTCTVIVSAGGYTKVIDEDFEPAVAGALLAVNCSAAQISGALQLTEPAETQAGAAFFRTKFPDGDFIADFDLRFDEPSAQAADGLCFVVSRAGDPTLCGAPGGGLGYFTSDANTGSTIPGIAFVFDSWQNGTEPSHNWAGLYSTPSALSSRLKAIDVPEELGGNGAFHATVTGKAGVFKLTLSNPSIGMAPREIFSHTIAGFAAGQAYFGFTAGTGGSWARHIVDNFVLQINTGAEPPVAAFSGSPLSGPVPLDVTFTNGSTGTTSYSWSFGDGQTSNEVSPTHAYDEPGTYSVSLMATGPGGSDTHTETDYVSVSATVIAEFSADPTTGRAPITITFTNQSTGATSYAWNFGDGGTSSAPNPTHDYVAGGQFTVTLTARGAGGAENTRTRTNYIQLDGILQADFAGLPAQGAAPLPVQFSDHSAGNTIQSRLWNFGDGMTSVQQNPLHTYAANGIYTVSLEIFGFAASDQEVKTGYIRVGSTSPIFLRGDSNNDTRADLSDAIFTLSYLFSGGPPPVCKDAADTDDSGVLDITDAIRLLGFLFQGGPPPKPPHPLSGEDPTADVLGCNL